MRRFSACLSRLLPLWLFHALCPRLISSGGRHAATPQLLHHTSAGLPRHLTFFPHLAYFPKVAAAAATVSRCRLTCVWQSLCDSCNQQCARWPKKNHDRLTADVNNRDEYLKIIVLWICWVSPRKQKGFMDSSPKFPSVFCFQFLQLGL